MAVTGLVPVAVAVVVGVVVVLVLVLVTVVVLVVVVSECRASPWRTLSHHSTGRPLRFEQ